MPTPAPTVDLLSHTDRFVERHVGPRPNDVAEMLAALDCASLDDLVDRAVPSAIRMKGDLRLDPPRGEREAIAELAGLARRNLVQRSFIGLGYHGTVTPAVIQRSILENPGWYTQYTPYQAEIAQGRLEALLNFQTMICELTGLPVANSSLLDEATAAAEAMTLCLRVKGATPAQALFFVSERCHPQTIAVVETRARPLRIEVVVGDHRRWDFSRPTFGALVQVPATDGEVLDYGPFTEQAHRHGALVIVAADLLSLTLLRPPGEFGADVAVGSSQRFGVPMGLGGPHAAFIAVRSEFTRQLPGRIVGVSKDAQGGRGLRLALQTREQHIRREKATSNICTAQVLLAVMASMYAVHHGPDGLTRIAQRVHLLTRLLRRALAGLGAQTGESVVFDTLRVSPGRRSTDEIVEGCERRRINLRRFEDGAFGIALDETTTLTDLDDLYAVFGGEQPVDWTGWAREIDLSLPAPHRRSSPFLTQPVFHQHHSETELLRYVKSLEVRDLSLTTAMIPLGSCTMKLNAAAEMYPITWPEFAELHPCAPATQVQGCLDLFAELERRLCEITGFAAVSFQPNAGAQGEYAGLLVIRAYHEARNEAHRDVCLIPESAHGTNPASAVMAGFRVVAVGCDAMGDVDLADLEAKAEAHRDRLAALMITYPSTHGVFEEGVKRICEVVHGCGGQVYLDGANLNALVGLCRPADLGGDVCHLNLHKTFAIPHGGGGPGMGPIAVAQHLKPFLPSHPLAPVGGERGIGPVAAAPWGSASILPISYAYISLLGAEGLKRASQAAILNANYVARRLEPYYPVVYKGKRGFVAHECIIDLRPLKATAGIDADDVAKRLMDYGFHAPTMSWPVPGTLMVEPTESESKAELDRFCEAMIMIREELREIEDGRADRSNNLLKNAPHTAAAIAAANWDRPYTRERAAFPTEWTRQRKFWPAVGRVDNVFGDRNLVCTCPPVAANR